MMSGFTCDFLGGFYEGTGIGLALVHELIGLLGGTITAASQLTVGTTFRLTLPVGPILATDDTPKISWSAPKLESIHQLTPFAPSFVIRFRLRMLHCQVF